MSSFYEIIELINGDVALIRADGEKNEPLVTIRFSSESLAFLGDEKFSIAQSMIEAGMEAAGNIADHQGNTLLDECVDELENEKKLTLH